MPFEEAVRYGALLRLSIDGPTGAGKTFTAMRLGREIIKRRYKGEGRIAVIDTEKESARKYALRPGEEEDVRKGRFSFLHMGLTDYHPQRYIDAIHDAENTPGVKVLIIDSLSHAWAGEGGVLELKDNAAKRSGNSYTAWGDVTPLQNKLISAITGSKLEIIATLRTKMDHVQEKDEKTGKTTVRKLGMAPVQRDGVEYEFDIVIDMDTSHSGFISKTRCVEIDGKVFSPPDEALVETLVDWLDGPEAPVVEPPPAPFDRLAPWRTDKTTHGLDWSAFTTHLKGLGIGVEDIVRAIAPNGAAPTAGDFIRWLDLHAGQTLRDAVAAIIAAKQRACEHDAGEFNEETTLTSCSKCGYVIDGPPDETTVAQPSLTGAAQ